RHGASTHTPVTGAIKATVMPAIVRARPSQLAGVVGPGRPAPTALVRENTNVTTIAFRPVDPQSHNAHASTRPRPGGLPMAAEPIDWLFTIVGMPIPAP